MKDHPTFLRAAARVRAAVPDAAFVIAGEGFLMKGLSELAEQLGIQRDVFFIGRCEDVGRLLAGSRGRVTDPAIRRMLPLYFEAAALALAAWFSLGQS